MLTLNIKLIMHQSCGTDVAMFSKRDYILCTEEMGIMSYTNNWRSAVFSSPPVSSLLPVRIDDLRKSRGLHSVRTFEHGPV